MNTPAKKKKPFFERFSAFVTYWSGRPLVFIIALIIVLAWAVTGPIFNFSDTWQLVINTGTTIITFLMVFVIQQTQNKDTMALQLKLNELVASSERASNRLVDIEDLSEEELQAVKQFYIRLAELAKKEKHLTDTHSFSEAEEKHEEKEEQQDEE